MDDSPAGKEPVRDPVLTEWVATRRKALAAAAVGPEPPNVPAAGDPWWGLALSGGGIRSATFALGVVSGLAANGLLRRFDLLSTVSGGGYIGSAVGKLYARQAPSTASNQPPAQEPGATPPPTTAAPVGAGTPQAGPKPLEVESRLAAADRTWFVWWLRATSRYLTPRGASDMLTAATTYARNMVAVHVEIGLAAMALGAILGFYNLFVWKSLYDWFGAHPSLLPQVGTFLQPWISTVWLLVVIPVLVGIPIVSAYWAIPARRGTRWVITQVAFSLLLAFLGVCAALIASRPSLWEPQHDAALGVFCGVLAVLLLLVALGPLVARLARIGGREPEAAPAAAPAPQRQSVLEWLKSTQQAAGRMLGAAVDTGASAQQRTRLTRWLAVCATVSFVIVVLGIVDRAAWFVAFERRQYTYLLPLVIAMGIAIAHTFASQASARDASTAVSERFVFRLAQIAGLLLFGLVVVFWTAVVDRVAIINLFAPEPSGDLLFDAARQVLLPFLSLPLLYMLLTCKKAEFCNLSSLHMFYRARLTRSYLGAGNPARFIVQAGNARRQDDPLDDATPAQLLESSERRRVFEVDPGDTVYMDDYSPHAGGGPVHILNVTVNQTRDPLGGLFNQDRKGQYLSVTSGGRYRIGTAAWQTDTSFGASQLPAWMAISGAAVAPGLGGQTSTGLALLLFMAGVRLGFWWDMAPARSRFRALLEALSPDKYRLMYGEAFAKFGGTGDRFWFLSDGGHFENTGAYALLREQAKLVVLVDAAADPHYAFENVENLVRKARIDLQADIAFIDPSQAGAKLARFGTLDQLRDPASDACLALARIGYGDNSHGWLVLVKPNMFSGLPVDVINYKRDHGAFPQEPTADQFFSESQWESYFRLGRELGTQLDPTVLQDLSRDQLWTRSLATSAAAMPPGLLPPGKAGEPSFSERFPRAASLAKSGVSLTALAAVLTATGQIWDKYSSERQTRSSTYWSDLYAASALRDHVLRQGDQKFEAELTAKVAQIANTFCHDGENDIAHGTQAADLYFDVNALCEDEAAHKPPERRSAACSTLQVHQVEQCLTGGNRLGRPAYWALDYTDPQWATDRVAASRERASAQLPSLADNLRELHVQLANLARGAEARLVALAGGRYATMWLAQVGSAPSETAAPKPQVAASAASRSPAAVGQATASAPAVTHKVPKRAVAPPAAAASGPCKGERVYIQIYNDDETGARKIEKQLTDAGARVPRIENVSATALRDGRTPPRPVSKPTAVYHTQTDAACANWIRAAQPESPEFVTRQLAKGLKGTQGVVELWLPPPPTP